MLTGMSGSGGLSFTVYEMAPQWHPPSYVWERGSGRPVVGDTGVSSDMMLKQQSSVGTPIILLGCDVALKI